MNNDEKYIGGRGADGPPGNDGASFYWLGAWNNSDTYVMNSVVSISGSSYIAIQENTNVNPLSNPATWNIMCLSGTSNLGYIGIWDIAVTYQQNQIVSFQDAGYLLHYNWIYIALQTGIGHPCSSSVLYWQPIIKNPLMSGAWSISTPYYFNNIVNYNGSSYILIIDSNTGTVPTDDNVWALIASKGDIGVPGVNYLNQTWDTTVTYNKNDIVYGSTFFFNTPNTVLTNVAYISLQDGNVGRQPLGFYGGSAWWNIFTVSPLYRGVWDSALYYGLDHMVTYNGQTYININTSNWNLNQQPNLQPTLWGLVSAQGIQGITGATEPTGATGPTGLQGPSGENIVPNYRGSWYASTDYIVNDSAFSNPFTYICIQGNVGRSPSSSPTFWHILYEGRPDNVNCWMTATRYANVYYVANQLNTPLTFQTLFEYGFSSPDVGLYILDPNSYYSKEGIYLATVNVFAANTAIQTNIFTFSLRVRSITDVIIDYGPYNTNNWGLSNVGTQLSFATQAYIRWGDVVSINITCNGSPDPTPASFNISRASLQLTYVSQILNS